MEKKHGNKAFNIAVLLVIIGLSMLTLAGVLNGFTFTHVFPSFNYVIFGLFVAGLLVIFFGSVTFAFAFSGGK